MEKRDMIEVQSFPIFLLKSLKKHQVSSFFKPEKAGPLHVHLPVQESVAVVAQMAFSALLSSSLLFRLEFKINFLFQKNWKWNKLVGTPFTSPRDSR